MKIRYKKSIVAFIDVLGFSNLIFNEKLDKIEVYYNYLLSDFRQFFKAEFKFTLISDSIVIYCNYNENNFKQLCYILSIIQGKLLLLKILVRGGISLGNLYVNKQKNVIVGDGLIKAYKLESEAIYPRIIIDREFIKIFSSGPTSEFGRNIGNISFDYRNSNDGYFFVDYVGHLIGIRSFYQNNRANILFEFIKENYYTNAHYPKFKWLLDKTISCLTYQAKYHSTHGGLSKKSMLKRKYTSEFLTKFKQL